MSLDELRRATEQLPGYTSMDYYSKCAWTFRPDPHMPHSLASAERLPCRRHHQPDTLSHTAMHPQHRRTALLRVPICVCWCVPHLIHCAWVCPSPFPSPHPTTPCRVGRVSCHRRRARHLQQARVGGSAGARPRKTGQHSQVRGRGARDMVTVPIPN